MTPPLDRLAAQLRGVVEAGRATEAEVAAWVRLVSRGTPLPGHLTPADAEVVQRVAWLMLGHAPGLDAGWLVMATMRCDLIAAGSSTWREAFDDVRLLEEISPHDGAATERVLALGGDRLREHVARALDAVRSAQPPLEAPGEGADRDDRHGRPAPAPKDAPPAPKDAPPASQDAPAAPQDAAPARTPAPAPRDATTAFFLLPRGLTRDRFPLRAAEVRLAWRAEVQPGPGARGELRFASPAGRRDASTAGLRVAVHEEPLLDAAGVQVTSTDDVDPGHPLLASLGALPLDAFAATTPPAADAEAWIHWLACAALAGPRLAADVAAERLATALRSTDAEVRFTAALAAAVGGWPGAREVAGAQLSAERDPRVRAALGRVVGRPDPDLETAFARWQQQSLPVWRGLLSDGDQGPGQAYVSRRDLDRLLWRLDLHLLQWTPATATRAHEKQWLSADGRALVRCAEDRALRLRVVQIEGPRADALGAALVAGLAVVDAAAALRHARRARRAHEALRALREVAAVAPTAEDPALVAAVDLLATHPDGDVRLGALVPIARLTWPGLLTPLARLLADERDPRVPEAAQLVATERSSRGAPWPAITPPPLAAAPPWPTCAAPERWVVERGVAVEPVLDVLAGHVWHGATPVPGHPRLFTAARFTSRDGATRVALRADARLAVVSLVVAGERVEATARELGRRVELLAPAAVRARARAGPPGDRAWALRALGVTAGGRYNLGVYQVLAAALQDPAAEIRLAAVEAVAAGAAWRELGPLLQRLLRREQDQAVVEATRAALRVLARVR